jgi:hypothetical protein
MLRIDLDSHTLRLKLIASAWRWRSQLTVPGLNSLTDGFVELLP